MARTKEEEAQWQSHREELKSLWLDQRWTAEKIQTHMSQRHGFHKSVPQYSRQFKKWALKKNSGEETWKFVAQRREKRKRDGKDPGPVWINGKLVPEPKIRKEIARHVSLSSQYCMGMGDSGPKTPKGVVVGTPRPEIDAVVPDTSANVLATDWCQNMTLDGMNFGTPSVFQPTDGNSFSFPIEVPGLDFPEFNFQGNEEPVVGSPNFGEAGSEYHWPVLLTPASRPACMEGNSYRQYDVSNGIVEETRRAPFLPGPAHGDDNPSDPLSPLDPSTIEYVNSELTNKAKAIFESPFPESLPHSLNLCIFLSSNNMMSQLATDNLVLLIAKTRSQPRLRALLESKTTTIEIFMSNLLASAAAVGEVEILQILIESGADLDASSGQNMRTTALHRALANNYIACVRILLEAGAEPNLAVDGKTPLHIACSTPKSFESVELLLRYGAHVNPPQHQSRLTPLQFAVQEGDIDLVELLLSKKADPNSFTTCRKGTALQMACHRSTNARVVEALIGAGADIDSGSGYRRRNRDADHSESSDTESDSEEDPDEDCWAYGPTIPRRLKPAILIAAESSSWEVVQLLLEEGASVNATLAKCPSKLLKCDIDESASLDDGTVVFNPLQAAVRAENITMIRVLLAAGAHIDARPKGKWGDTALQMCAMMGNDRIMEILLQKGADVNAPAGVYHGRTALQAAASHSDTKMLSMLLREGADVNAPPSNEKGRTALQVAVAAGNTEGVRILLEAQAAVNTSLALTGGTTALQQALQITDLAIRKEIVHLLLRAGASTQHPENENVNRPLHVAVRMGDMEMTKRFLQEGAAVHVGHCLRTKLTPLQQASSEGNELLVKLLIDHGADVNGPAHPSGGRTALQAAVERSHVSMVKILLKLGANIKSPQASVNGISAIEGAARICNQELVEIFLDKEPDVILSDPTTKTRIIGLALGNWRCDVPFLELLLKNGAEVKNACLPESRPLLQRAVAMHDFQMVQCLLNAGANVNERWVCGVAGNVTALQVAVFRRNIDIIQLLLERGADVNLPANNLGGKTALQIAVSQNEGAMVELLIRHGADVNGLPSPVRGRTALQEAAGSGFLRLTESLLAYGAHVNAPAAHVGGVTALQAAAITGNSRIVMTLLVAGADVNGAPAIERGRHAIECAAVNGRLDTLHMLLNFHPDTEDFEFKRKRAAKMSLANGYLAIGRFLLAYRKQTRG